jgi:LPXTG-motif cell wall-anchored protein
VVTQHATIAVDPAVQTSLAASAPDVRFVKVGDQVQEQGSTNLNWTATHADSVKIEPIGPVSGTSGSQTISPTPTQSQTGPIDEMLTYRLTASNQCGGTDTSTASVHLTGSITEPPPPAPVAEAKPPELPHTASPLPLLALIGVLSVAGGLMLRLKRMKT